MGLGFLYDGTDGSTAAVRIGGPGAVVELQTTSLSPRWTDQVAVAGHLVSYDGPGGHGWINAIGAAGSIRDGRALDLGDGWTSVLGIDDRLVLYARGSGQLLVGRVDATGMFVRLHEEKVSAGWTSLTSCGDDLLFADQGGGWLTALAEDGTITSVGAVPFPEDAERTVAIGREVLRYDRLTGHATVGRVGGDGSFTLQGSPPLAPGWTSIVPLDGGLLLYAAGTGDSRWMAIADDGSTSGWPVEGLSKGCSLITGVGDPPLPPVWHLHREDLTEVLHPEQHASALAIHPRKDVAYLGRTADTDPLRRNLISVTGLAGPPSGRVVRRHPAMPTPLAPLEMAGANDSLMAIAVHPTEEVLYCGTRLFDYPAEPDRFGRYEQATFRSLPRPELGAAKTGAEYLTSLQFDVLSVHRLDGEGRPVGAPEVRSLRSGTDQTWRAITALTVHPLGGHLYVASDGDDALITFDLIDGIPTESPSARLPLTSDGDVLGFRIAAMDVTADGQHLAVTSTPRGNPEKGIPFRRWTHLLEIDASGRPKAPTRPGGVVTWDDQPARALHEDREPCVLTTLGTGSRPAILTAGWDRPTAWMSTHDQADEGPTMLQVTDGPALALDVPAPWNRTWNKIPKRLLPDGQPLGNLIGTHRVAARTGTHTAAIARAVRGPHTGGDAEPFEAKRVDEDGDEEIDHWFALRPGKGALRLESTEIVQVAMEGRGRDVQTLATMPGRRVEQVAARGDGSGVVVVSSAIPDRELPVHAPAASGRVELRLLSCTPVHQDGADGKDLFLSATDTTVRTASIDVGLWRVPDATGKALAVGSQAADAPAVDRLEVPLATLRTMPDYPGALPIGLTTTPGGAVDRASLGLVDLEVEARLVAFDPSAPPPHIVGGAKRSRVRGLWAHFFVDLDQAVLRTEAEQIAIEVAKARSLVPTPVTGPKLLMSSAYHLRAQGDVADDGSVTATSQRGLLELIAALGFNGLERGPAGGIDAATVDALAPASLGMRHAGIGHPFGSAYFASVLGDPLAASTHAAIAADLDASIGHLSLRGTERPLAAFTLDDHHLLISQVAKQWTTGTSSMSEAFGAFLVERSRRGELDVADVASAGSLAGLDPFDLRSGFGSDQPSRARRYWTARFFGWEMAHAIGVGAEVLKGQTFTWPGATKAQSRWLVDPNCLVGAQLIHAGRSFEPGADPFITADLMAGVRAGLFNPYEYALQDTWPAGISYRAALLRSAAMNTDDGSFPTAPARPSAGTRTTTLADGSTMLRFGAVLYAGIGHFLPDLMTLGTLGLAGRGGDYLANYTLGPAWQFGNGYLGRDAAWTGEHGRQAALTNRLLAAAEDHLVACSPPRPKVALLLSTSSDVWERPWPASSGSTSGPHAIRGGSEWWFELRALHWALRLAGFEVDLVAEEDIAGPTKPVPGQPDHPWVRDPSDNALVRRGYQALYAVGANISAPAQAAIDRWVREDGGHLVAIMSAGTADEYDRPTTTFTDLLGLATHRECVQDGWSWSHKSDVMEVRCTIPATDGAPASSLDLLLVGPCLDLQVGGAVQVADVRAVRDDLTATRPAIARHDLPGEGGSAWSYAFAPGTQVADRVATRFDASGNALRHHDLWSPPLIDLVRLPLDEAGIDPEVAVPDDGLGVEATVMRDPDGGPRATITLLNWTPDRRRPVLLALLHPTPGAVEVTLASGQPVAATTTDHALLVSLDLGAADVVLVHPSAVPTDDMATFASRLQPPESTPARQWIRNLAERCPSKISAEIRTALGA